MDVDSKIPRIATLNREIVPFRAPEVDRLIAEFGLAKLCHRDEDQSPDKRFGAIDGFRNQFEVWSGISTRDFSFYSVAGSTEAINWCVRDLKARGKTLAMLSDEYTYYKFLAESCAVPTRVVSHVGDLDSDCVFVLSQPYCRSGTVSEFHLHLLKSCEARQIEVWLDMAYLGSTSPVQLYIPSTTSNIFFSLSKQFALASLRLGIWLSRSQVPEFSILMSRGYVNVGALNLGTALMNRFPSEWLHSEYQHLQKKLAKDVSQVVYMCKTQGCLTFDFYRQLNLLK